MTTIAWVFARGGSRGLARKNLRLLCGKPLLAWAIEAAQQATLVDRVIVSTEDAEIAETALRFGAEVLGRPPELATDDSPEWLSWQHAVRSVPCDLFVSVPCTAPLRLPGDVDAVIRKLTETDAAAVITVTEAHRNPYFNQVTEWEGGTVRPAMRYYGPDVTRRQDAPEVWDVTTVAYAARPEFILRASGLWGGRVCSVAVPKEWAVDIDTELDLRIAEMLMRERERGKEAW